MNTFFKSAVVVAIIGLTGCVPPPPPLTLQSTFDVAHAQALLVVGENSIKGSGLLRQRGGGVVTCAGNVVHLVPATEYAKEIFERHSATGFDSVHPQFGELQKETRCDAQGFFAFKNLADGEFFVETTVTWTAPQQDILGGWYQATQGGALNQHVSVAGGETKEIVLTR